MNSSQKGKAGEDAAERLAHSWGWATEFKPVRSVRPIGPGRYISHRVDYDGCFDFVFFNPELRSRVFVQVKTSKTHFSEAKAAVKAWAGAHISGDSGDYAGVWLMEKVKNRWTLVGVAVFNDSTIHSGEGEIETFK